MPSITVAKCGAILKEPGRLWDRPALLTRWLYERDMKSLSRIESLDAPRVARIHFLGECLVRISPRVLVLRFARGCE
jgi:hypothetical protein